MLALVDLVIDQQRIDCFLAHVTDSISLFLVDWYHLDLCDLLKQRNNQTASRLVQFLLTDESVAKFISNEHAILEAMQLAARRGDRALVQMIVTYYDATASHAVNTRNNPLLGAVESGNLEIYKLLFGQFEYYLEMDGLLERAASAGHLAMIEFLCAKEQWTDFDLKGAAVAAVKNDHVEIVKYLAQQKLCPSEAQNLVEYAVIHGNTHIIDVLGTILCGKLNSENSIIMDSINSHRREFAKVASVEAMQWAIKQVPSLLLDECVVLATSEAGNLEVVKWLLARQQMELEVLTAAVTVAADNGHFQLVQHLVEKYGVKPVSLHKAIANGHVELVRFLVVDHGLKCCGLAFNASVENGHADMVRLLLSNECGVRLQSCSHEAMETTALNGHCQVLRLVNPDRTRGFAMAKALVKAASRGDLTMLRYLFERPPNPSAFRKAIDEALRFGQSHAAEILINEVKRLQAVQPTTAASTTVYDDVFDKTFLQQVASSSYRGLNGIEFLLRASWLDGLDLSEVISRAAGERKLKFIQWLHSKQAEGFSVETMNRAAWAGAMTIVEFLHEHRNEGCTVDAMDMAAANGYLQVVQFLHENRHEGCSSKAMNEAAANGHLRVVQFLHEKCRRDHHSRDVQAITRASANGRLAVVKYLHAQGYLCSSAAVLVASSGGHDQVVEFLVTQGCALVPPNALQIASKYGHWRVVEWLVTNGHEVHDRSVRFGSSASERRRFAKVVECLEASSSSPRAKRQRVV